MNCPRCGAMNAPYSPACAYCGQPLAPGGAAPQMPPQMVVGVQPHTSGWAIAGLITSFFCGLLGLVFSAIALSKINHSMGMLRGRGLAIAGIVISVLSMIGSFHACGRGYYWRHRDHRIHIHVQAPAATPVGLASAQLADRMLHG